MIVKMWNNKPVHRIAFGNVINLYMDKVLFVGVGEAGSLFVEKVNDELAKIGKVKGLQVSSVNFSNACAMQDRVKGEIEHYNFNDMVAEQGKGFTSRRDAKEYREVAEFLKDDIRSLLQQYLDSEKD